jgi:O-antigen ligase
LLLGSAAVAAILYGRWRMRSAPSDLCLASTLALVGYLVAREWHSPVISFAREDFFLLLGCLAVYALSATAFSSAAARNLILTALVVVTVGNLAIGFIHFSGQWTFHIVPGYMRSFGSHRIGGFFNNPNHLASFLTIMVLLLARMVLFGGLRGGVRVLLGFLAIASSIGVVLTVSRGALVSLGVGVAVLIVVSLAVLRSTHRDIFSKAVMGVVVLTVLVSTTFFALFSEQLRTRFHDGDQWDHDPRSVIWESAMTQHQLDPWYGVGARMFYTGCITYRSPAAAVWMQDAFFVHNEYLQMLTDYGRIGLALAALAALLHFGNGARFLRWYTREKFPTSADLGWGNLGFTIGALSALAATLAHALIEFHFHVPAVALTIAFLFGVLANPGRENPLHRSLNVPLVRPLLKLAMLAAGGAMIWGALRLGVADYDRELATLHPQEDDMDLTRIVWLTKAIERDPLNDAYWFQRGLARKDAAVGQAAPLAKGFLQLAIPDLEKARQLNPYDMFMAVALAETYDFAGRNADAERCLADALRLAPRYMEPRLGVALHYHRHGRFAEAERAYLWAKDAPAGGSSEWFRLYQQMLLKDSVKR